MRLGVAIFVLLAVTVAIHCDVTPPPAGSRIPIDGKDAFLLGVNYPWAKYGSQSNYGRDFGTNAWGYNGFAKSGNANSNGQDLTSIANNDAKVIRVWVFADGRAGIALDKKGYPGSVQPQVYKDMDALIGWARSRGLRLVLVLFDFKLGFNANTVNKVMTQGRNSWINFAPHRSALINTVLPGFLKKYGQSGVIHSWEVMNEPEWLIWDLPQSGYKSGEAPGCSFAEFSQFASGICKAVHANTKHYCTLGSASLKWARVWTPAYAAKKGTARIGLDYYQAHYYNWMDGQQINNDPNLGTVNMSPLVQTYQGLKLDRPLVIGEFYKPGASVQNLLNTFLKNGYAGGWPWSINSDYNIDLGDLKAFANANSAVISQPLVAPRALASSEIAEAVEVVESEDAPTYA